MTKTETIKQILKLTKKEKSSDSEVFDKLTDRSDPYLTKLLKVIKGL